MLLEHVWAALEQGEWKSETRLRDVSGVDADSLTLIIEFLARWDFIETRRSPDLLVRRKPSAISPMETFEQLHSIATQKPAGLRFSSEHRELAEPAYFRTCAERSFRSVGEESRHALQDLVGSVWRCMNEGEYYSIHDLSTLLATDEEQIRHVLGFLHRYGFGELRSELFKKAEGAPSPRDAYQAILGPSSRPRRHVASSGES